MKNKLFAFLTVALFASLSTQLSTVRAQGSAFTYQGRLNAGGSPVTGNYDLTFTLFNVSTGIGQVSDTITNLNTAVSNGQFTVTLDFGNQFPGANRWLEVGVRTNGGSAFVTLNPRQPITSTPYALRANNTDLAAAVAGIRVNTNVSSTALGFNTSASGSASTALGQGSQASGLASTAMGNNTTASGSTATAMGRSTVASGSAAFASGRDTVAGGDYSTALGRSTTANGLDATALGHQTIASGAQATASGESTTAAGIASFAAGTQSRANHDGSFVWADYNFVDFASTAANQFLIRAAGGVGINTNNPNGAALAVNGSLAVSGMITGNASGLTNVAVNSLVRTTTNCSIVGWGNNGSGQTTIPVGLDNVTAVAAGGSHSLALKSDGTVVAWGNNDNGQTNVPAGLSNVTSVAAGDSHSLALKSDGTVVAWGNNGFGQTNVPAGLNNVAAVAAGSYHNLALKTDGTVVAWGSNGWGETNTAGLSNVTAVAGGNSHSLVLKSDGTVVAWGYNHFGQMNVPAGLSNVVAVAAGYHHNLALKSDGTVVGWGDSIVGRSVPVGLSNVTAVAAANSHCLGLKSDGTVVAWGAMNVPAGLSNVIVVAAGPSASHVLVIRRQPYSPMAWLNADNTFNGNIQVNGTLTGNGSGLTSLSAANLTGSVPSASLTSVPAESLTGAISDARLSTNVALRTGGNAFNGNQTIVGSLGVGTVSPQGSLHVYSVNNPTVVRVQSTGTPGAARVEFVSNPQGDVNEWRPGFIESTDSGGFTGGLTFNVNGTGAGNKFGSVEVMRVVNGRVGIGTNNPQSALQVVGTVTATAFNPPSDRNLKENFTPVSPREVLEKVTALPITRWNFKGDTATPHVGPMAQDFHAAFNLGTDERHIATVDADGVALAAIQGLNQKLEARIKELEQRLEKMEQMASQNRVDAK